MRNIAKSTRRATAVTLAAALAVACYLNWQYARTGMDSLAVETAAAPSAGSGASAFYALWTAEMFATPYRASAQGVLFFVARILVGVLSYFFPTLLATQGVGAVGMIMIGLLVAAMLIGVIWAPDTRGKTLEQIEVERYGEHVTP